MTKETTEPLKEIVHQHQWGQSYNRAYVELQNCQKCETYRWRTELQEWTVVRRKPDRTIVR